MSKHDDDDENGGNHERWLLTYADMITLLLVLFIVMYTMSTVDLKKFKALAENLGSVFVGSNSGNGSGNGTGNGSGSSHNDPHKTKDPHSTMKTMQPVPTTPTAGTPLPTQIPATNNNFDKIYELIKDDLKNNGLDDNVDILKGDNYMLLNFRDTVLFYPDSSNMKTGGNAILKNICSSLLEVNNYIAHIQIDGHTAKTSDDNKDSIFAWQLSSDRAIQVLKFMVQNDIPPEKMSVAGYSRYDPIASNDTEEGRAKNRRVEIKITQITEDNAD